MVGSAKITSMIQLKWVENFKFNLLKFRAQLIGKIGSYEGLETNLEILENLGLVQI